MRNITLSADEQVIDRARERARAAGTTLNEEFRSWLESYATARDEDAVDRFRQVMAKLEAAGVDAGRAFTRDEANER